MCHGRLARIDSSRVEGLSWQQAKLATSGSGCLGELQLEHLSGSEREWVEGFLDLLRASPYGALISRYNAFGKGLVVKAVVQTSEAIFCWKALGQGVDMFYQ